ncbi:MAG TPA: J domain-containing protein [Candidatus Limnocylindrales bacterium]|nr:J domain-containing protein [Candidatus Limnocylindrales bacterium]
MTDPVADPYKTLQVDPEAEDEVIVAAYRRLARKYHPDSTGASDPGAAAKMAGLNAAWEVIGDPMRRAAFDRERALREALGRRASDPPPGPTVRAADAAPATARSAEARPPETVSRDWTGGRSSVGGGYDASMHRPDGEGAAGKPPGDPSGSVLTFGRYLGWSLGEIARRDLEYIEWLDRMPIGRPYRDEIDAILRRSGRRRSADAESADRRGLFRRR